MTGSELRDETMRRRRAAGLAARLTDELGTTIVYARDAAQLARWAKAAAKHGHSFEALAP